MNQLIKVCCALGLAAGCGPSAAEMQKLHTDISTERTTQLKKRASFDLGCDNLEITCLSQETWSNDVEVCHSAGVSGCGHRLTYVWTQTGRMAEQWVLNSDAKPVAAPEAPEAPEAPANATPPSP